MGLPGELELCWKDLAPSSSASLLGSARVGGGSQLVSRWTLWRGTWKGRSDTPVRTWWVPTGFSLSLPLCACLLSVSGVVSVTHRLCSPSSPPVGPGVGVGVGDLSPVACLPSETPGVGADGAVSYGPPGLRHPPQCCCSVWAAGAIPLPTWPGPGPPTPSRAFSMRGPRQVRSAQLRRHPQAGAGLEEHLHASLFPKVPKVL